MSAMLTRRICGIIRINVRPFAFVVGAHKSHGLVYDQQQTVGMIERFTVDPYIGRRGLLRDVIRDLTADGDTAGFDPVPRVAPAAVAEVGEELIEAAHDGGEIAQRGTQGAKEKVDFIWPDHSF